MCGQCGVTFLHPVPQDLSAYYASGYYSIPLSVDELRATAEGDRYKLDIVLGLVQRGRLLEIGAGTGAFAHLAKEAGFEVEALEMDADCCRFLEQVVGVRTIHSSDPHAAFARSQSFDVIAMWQVLEHLPLPRETVELAAASLSRGGILVVATPNPDSMQFRMFRSYWAHLDAPRHLQLIPLEALQSRATATGLSLRTVTTSDEGAQRCNNFGWHQSLRNVFGKRRGGRRLGSALSRVGPLVESHGMLGSCYTAVFVKE